MKNTIGLVETGLVEIQDLSTTELKNLTLTVDNDNDIYWDSVRVLTERDEKRFLEILKRN